MRKLVLYLLLMVYFPVHAQENDSIFIQQVKEARQSRYEGLKTLGIYSISIILNSIGDGLNDSNKKTAGHLFNAASIGTLVASPFILYYRKNKWPYYLACYTTLRIGLFDTGYNITRKLPYNYTGSTSLTDKAYNKFGGQPTFPRIVGLTIGIGISFNEFK